MYIGILKEKKRRILEIRGMKTNIIIDTLSYISIDNSKYHAAINSPKPTSYNISISGIT